MPSTPKRWSSGRRSVFSGIRTNQQLEELFQLGLAKWIDGFTSHPYKQYPPERNNLVSDLRATREKLNHYAGREIPMFNTESGLVSDGSPDSELRQACGLVRHALISLGEGIRFSMAFYEHDYGPTTKDAFGFFYNLDPKNVWNTNKDKMPKPAVPAYAAASFLLDGHRPVSPIEWLGDTAIGYAYEREGNVTLALWDFGDSGTVVKLPVGAPKVTVYDMMGNSVKTVTANGILKLSLENAPVYVTGVSAGIWGRNVTRPLTIRAGKLVTGPDSPIRLSVDVGAPADKPLSGTVLLEADDQLMIRPIERSVELKAGETKVFDFDLATPAGIPVGVYGVKTYLRQGSDFTCAAGALVSVKSQTAIDSIRPELGKAGAKGVRVAVRETLGRPFEGKLVFRIPGEPDSQRVCALKLGAQESSEAFFDLSGLPLLPNRNSVMTVAVEDCRGTVLFSEKRNINFMGAPHVSAPPPLAGDLSGWANIPSYLLQGREWVMRSPNFYKGEKDIAAAIRYAWDEKALYMAVEVFDDVFSQNNVKDATWQGDCIQAAFNLDPGVKKESTGNTTLDDNNKLRVCELEFALTRNGAEVYRGITFNPAKCPFGLLEPGKIHLTARRVNESNGDLVYEIAIPWKELGAERPPQAGERIGIALTVNDMDDPKEQGIEPKAVGIFGGIANGKDPANFGELILQGE